jgi:AraC-like DNA-binding protein
MEIYMKQGNQPNIHFEKHPRLAYAGHICNDPNWAFPSHMHRDISELLYITEGEGSFIIDGVTYKAGKGYILIYNPGIIHDERSSSKDPLNFYFCGLADTKIKGLRKGCILPCNIPPVIHADEYTHKMESYIRDILQESYSQGWGFETICQSLLISLIVLLFRVFEAKPSAEPLLLKENPITAEIKEYIESNYSSNISLNEISKRLYLSPDYISHVFKDNTGYSPIKYLINKRIDESKKLLLTTGMTVQEVSIQVGYENANYFSIIFKKITGTSPREYRLQSK